MHYSQLSFSPCSQWSACPAACTATAASAGAAAAANSGGLSSSQINSRQDPHEVPSNSKINPQTPLRSKREVNYKHTGKVPHTNSKRNSKIFFRIENENFIDFINLVSRSNCGQTADDSTIHLLNTNFLGHNNPSARVYMDLSRFTWSIGGFRQIIATHQLLSSAAKFESLT